MKGETVAAFAGGERSLGILPPDMSGSNAWAEFAGKFLAAAVRDDEHRH